MRIWPKQGFGAELLLKPVLVVGCTAQSLLDYMALTALQLHGTATAKSGSHSGVMHTADRLTSPAMGAEALCL